MDGWILTKPAQINYWEIEKNWSDFGDLDLFQSHWRSKNIVNCLVFIIFPKWTDWLIKAWNIDIYIILEIEKKYNKFWWPFPYFQGHREVKECWKMTCLHHISWRNGWIVTKLAKIQHLIIIGRGFITDLFLVTLTHFFQDNLQIHS